MVDFFTNFFPQYQLRSEDWWLKMKDKKKRKAKIKLLQENFASHLLAVELFANFFPQCILRQEVWSQITNYKKFLLEF